MAEVVSVANMVKRTAKGASLDAAVARPPEARPGRTAMWAVALLLGLGALVPIAQVASGEIAAQTLLSLEPTALRAKLAEPLANAAPADYYETLGELALGLKSPERSSAYRAMKRAVALDPSRAFAWANLAWLEADRKGEITPDATAALSASMNACLVCDPDLVRWRFNFVLAHWEELPEGLRRQAFEQADLLRWKGNNAEFLASMRLKAEAAGVPFEAYRTAVKTPVRFWDLAPDATSARGARLRGGAVALRPAQSSDIAAPSASPAPPR